MAGIAAEDFRQFVEPSRGDDAGYGDGVLKQVAEGVGQFVALHLLDGHGLVGVQQDGQVQFLRAGEEPVEWRFIAPGAGEVRVMVSEGIERVRV